MSINIKVDWDRRGLAALESAALKAAIKRVLIKAGATAQRDMRSEANKRIRALKRIKLSYIRDALTLQRVKGSNISSMSWALNVSGKPVPLIAYPNRQTKQGVSVEVNQGKRTVVKGSFIATMRSGHKGVFKRVGAARLPIRELLGSRPIDALLHKGEAQAVAERGGKSFAETYQRLLRIALGSDIPGGGGQ